MTSETQGLSYVVPAYNEEASIAATLAELDKVLATLDMPYEIIVANDGSRDRTAEIASGFANVRVISHPTNVGYGNALKTGILNARYDWIGIVDADSSYPIHEIPRLVEEMKKGFNMVVAARENIASMDKFVKRQMRRVYKRSIQLLTGHYIPDPNSGLRIFEREVAMEFLDFLCGAFSFTTSLSIFATEKPYFVKFVPVTYLARTGSSHVRHFRDTLRTIQLIIQCVTYYNPMKFFVFMSIAMIFLVGFPAMCLAMFNMHTLSAYYMIFGCTTAVLCALGILGDIVRVSSFKMLGGGRTASERRLTALAMRKGCPAPEGAEPKESEEKEKS